MLVSDNGTCFTSAEFASFMKQNGICHVRSAPFHPSSNGLAERAVQTFKEGMKKMKGETVQIKLSRFLFSYCITPHATTGLSPAELMMSRRLRSALDLILPDLSKKVQQKQLQQKHDHDKNSKLRSFATGDSVLVGNYSYGPKWIPAVVQSSLGPVTYTVSLGSGQTMKRHVDQVRAGLTAAASNLEPNKDFQLFPDNDPGAVGPLPAVLSQGGGSPSGWPPDQQPAPEAEVRPESLDAPVVRRSTRERRLPAHLRDFAS